MIKFSIILPIYNTEKYVDKCITSVISQTYKEWELIIINDGSTDRSFEIAKKYEGEDSRIKVYSQENQGVSSARNLGMKYAKGKYIMFLDSDDWYERNLLEIVSQYDYDFLCFGFYKRFLDKSIKMCDDSINLNNLNSTIEQIHTNHYIEGFLPLKVYSKEIIKKNNLIFDKNIHYCEDLMFVDEYISHCESFKYIPIPLYNYRMRKSSASFNFLNKKNISILEAYKFFINKYSENKIVFNYNRYKYLLYYYKLKKVVDGEYDDYTKKLLKCEKEIFTSINLTFKEKMNYFIIKKSYFLYLFLKMIKDYNLKLYK